MRSALKMLRTSRRARVALICAAVLVLAGLSFYFGRFIQGAILFLVAAAIAAAFFTLVIRPARIPPDAILTIRLSGTLPEEPRRSILEQLFGRGFPSLAQIRYALEAARSDLRLRAIVLEIAALGNGLATAEELHDLVRALRDSGKRVIAVLEGDFVTVRDLMVACAAGEVVVNPDAMFAMLGVSAGGLFLKGALDRLKVQAQTLQWKEYKGAGETFSRESMSAPLRESIEAIVSDWREALAARIAGGRRLSPERARELVGAGFLSARSAREAGLLDREGYAEDVRAEFDPEGRRKKFVGFARYLRHVAYSREGVERHRIALVCGVGPVVAGEPPSAGEFISPYTTGAQIERASRDEQVKAIVFRVNSPGGSAVGSDLIWRAVRAAQGRGKPVVVSMGDVAGSGGYYVAMCADAIVAEPSTVTGSIGVVYTKFDLSRLLAQTGIHLELAKSHPVSDAFSPRRAMSEEELAQLNGVIGHLYENFTRKVADGRRLSVEATEELARGRVWSGSAARALGLVDDVGGLARAIQLAREKARIPAGEPHELVSYSQARLIAALRLTMSNEAGSAWTVLGGALGVPSSWMPALASLIVRGGAMLLAPFVGW